MHSRSTTYYQLPQFNSSDKPTWLGDINGAMLAIDSAIHDAAADATQASETATSALAALNGALERAQQADTKATQALSTANAASDTATAAAATAAQAQSDAATALAARWRKIWAVADATADQTPANVTLENITAANKLFMLVFNDSKTNVKSIVTGVIFGEAGTRAAKIENDAINGYVDQYYREISLAQADSDITMSIGACNKLSNNAGTVTPTIDNSQLILAAVFAADIPAA